MTKLINYRRRGGLRFVTIGRLNVSWSVKRWRPTVARPIGWDEPLMSAETEAHVDALFTQLRRAL